MKFKKFKEQLFICWGGLRGAVPIILATYLLVAKTPEAHTMFNIIFFVVIVSMLLQGLTITPVGKWLGVEHIPSPKPQDIFRLKTKSSELVEYELTEDSKLVGHYFKEVSPRGRILILLIRRDGVDFIPTGDTLLRAQDQLICLVRRGTRCHFGLS